MFRIKNVRNNTVSKQINLSPIPHQIKPINHNPPIPANIRLPETKINNSNTKNPLKLTHHQNVNFKPQNTLSKILPLAQGKKKVVLKMHQDKNNNQIQMVHQKYQRKEKVQILQQAKEETQTQLIHRVLEINEQKIKDQPFEIKEIKRQQIINHQIEDNKNKKHIKEYLKQQEEIQVKRQKEVDLKNQQKKVEENEENLSKSYQHEIDIARIMQRRKKRQQQKLFKQKREQQRKQLQQIALKSLQNKEQNREQLYGMINLTDQLSHIEMSEAIMDIQINRLLKMNFVNFPNKQQIQAQKEELERINLSYTMVRDQPNHPLIDGLRNFRTEIFNRIGFLIMQAQQEGVSHQNFTIINADNRVYPSVYEEQAEGPRNTAFTVQRGLTPKMLKQLLKEYVIEVDDECAICLHEIERSTKIYQIKCGHVFHQKCLQQWLQNTANCPSCRYNIKFDKS